MAAVFAGAQRPTGLVLTGPLTASAACGDEVAASEARITIRWTDQVVFDSTLALPFQFER